jgi:homoserine dehydrogenase
VSGEIVVLKFGSSVLRSADDLPTAVHEIYRWYRMGRRVLAVVSAIGDTTERLLAVARATAAEPEAHATAELLATGERQSAALLGIALDRGGVPARILDPREIQLTAFGSIDNSEPVAVDRNRLQALFAEIPVLVAPGFFAYDVTGRLRLLGRGGSDLSAVFLAQALGAKTCRLLKDVDGVYDRDPSVAAQCPPRRYVTLSYADALDRATPLIQSKAVQFLERYAASVEIARIGRPYGSIVGSSIARFAEQSPQPPTSVLLLGCGTVGHGVYQRLIALPDHFRPIGVLIRERAKYEALGIPRELILTLDDRLGCLRPDVVIDALPGLEPSRSLLRQFLALGIAVVSANKVGIAELASISDSRARLRYSAAVGGSVPMIEAVDRERTRGDITAISGVLNGTCNFILSRIAAGMSFADALAEAHWRGFAEGNPIEDLSGRDSERKLRILARHAFNRRLVDMAVEELSAASVTRARQALRPGETLRYVARAWQAEGHIHGQVRLVAYENAHAFAQNEGEWNTLTINRSPGESLTLRGRGAGCWPTTEAIMADLFEERFGQLTAFP